MAITISGSGITSANIADGTIVNADVADVAASKLTGALPAIDGASLTGIAASFADLTDTTVSTVNPTSSTNPSNTGHIWINKTFGTQYVCLDNTAGSNVWSGLSGTATFDFLQDSSAVSLHRLNNSYADTGGLYSATTGGSFTTTSKFGSHCINTMGDGTYMDIAGLPRIYAISYWYYCSGADDGYHVDFRHDSPGNGRGYLYTHAGGGDQKITTASDTTTSGAVGDIYINGNILSGQFNFYSGNWYHIVISVNATTTAQTWDRGIRVGNRSDGTTAGNAGYFDQIRTFNRALIQTDVDKLFVETEI